MKRIAMFVALLAFVALPALSHAPAAANPAATKPAADATKPAAGEWSLDGTIIEACSCPMFCSCYFGSGHPAGHHDIATHTEEHFCRFNNVYRVNHGHYKGVKLDGAKFWVAGDLGGDFTKGEADWGMLVFDKTLSKEQRDGIAMMMGKMYPMKWNSFTTGEGVITWEAGKGEAHATLDGGKGGEVKLASGGFAEKGATPVIHGLQYWAADHNDGFVLMPNSVESFQSGRPFTYNGTNGFMITVHMADHPAAGGKSGL